MKIQGGIIKMRSRDFKNSNPRTYNYRNNSKINNVLNWVNFKMTICAWKKKIRGFSNKLEAFYLGKSMIYPQKYLPVWLSSVNLYLLSSHRQTKNFWWIFQVSANLSSRTSSSCFMLSTTCLSISRYYFWIKVGLNVKYHLRDSSLFNCFQFVSRFF